MKITTFAKRITAVEGKKTQVNIAQVLEIVKIINTMTNGLFYIVIRWMK
jgi:hypothetical protein